MNAEGGVPTAALNRNDGVAYPYLIDFVDGYGVTVTVVAEVIVRLPVSLPASQLESDVYEAVIVYVPAAHPAVDTGAVSGNGTVVPPVGSASSE